MRADGAIGHARRAGTEGTDMDSDFACGCAIADGRKQTLAAAGMKVREMLEEVERVARWSGDERNPFDAVREARAKRLGL